MKQRQNPAQHARAGAPSVQSADLRLGKAPACVLLPASCVLLSASYVLLSWISARSRRFVGSLALSLSLTGCTHKPHWVLPASASAPVELDPTPEPTDEPVIAALTPPEWVPPEIPEPPRRPVRRRPSPAPARESSAAQPPQVAAAEPAELAIGSLSTGGDTTPQAQQQARDLISTIQKRVSALPRSTANQQRGQLRHVTSFLKQAQQALESGDAEGAVTLATKARLIMDDIEKK